MPAPQPKHGEPCKPELDRPLLIKTTADTPRVPKYAHSAAPDLCTEGQRKVVLKDLREVAPYLDVEVFFGPNGLLPDLHPDIVKKGIATIVDELKSEKTIYSNGHWSNFKKTDCETHEDDIYAVFPDIVRLIVAKSGVCTSEPTLTFECNPKGVLLSSTRDNNSKPDCIGRLSSASSDYLERQWIEVAVAGEFKKKATDDNLCDDATKVIWSINHLMREDVRRRFVFGFTLEKWTMRLWFASRSDMFVSSEFVITSTAHDFLNHRRFVEFILRLVFATPEQLGWDETIRRIEPISRALPVQYDIEVRGKTYRTIRLLSNIGAEALRGRGTRVWEVNELSANEEVIGEPLVLKDSWVDSSRMREGDILKAIRKSAEGVSEAWCQRAINKCFMDTIDYGDVLVSGRPDDTFEVMRRGQVFDRRLGALRVVADPTEHKTMVSGLPVVDGLLAPKQVEEELKYSAKVHHRTIFKQVGKRLTAVSSLSKVFKHLMEVITGLMSLHKTKWAHRDISLGNILVILLKMKGREKEIAKITDVEYARLENADSTERSVRTGTLFFMATEVELHRYLYTQGELADKEALSEEAVEEEQRRLVEALDLDDDEDGDGADEEPSDEVQTSVSHAQLAPTDAASTSARATRPPVTRLPFRHNPLHDLESVFWVALWMLLCSEFVKKSDNLTDVEWEGYLTAHGEFAAKLFCDTHFRRNVMTLSKESSLLSEIDRLAPRVQDILLELEQFRKLLLTQYIEFEKRLDPDYKLDFDHTTDGSRLHLQLSKILGRIADTLSSEKDGGDLTIIVKEEPIPVKIVKKTLREMASQQNAAAAPNAPTRPSADVDVEPSSRPTKARKTGVNQFAGMASAPTAPTRYSARLQAKGTSGAGTSRSGRR